MSDHPFHVGQRVVCVDNTETSTSRSNEPWELKLNAVYTIESIGNWEPDEHGVGGAVVHLVEIIRVPCAHCGKVIAFYAKRFRPLEERDDSITIFRAMCAPDALRQAALDAPAKVKKEKQL